MPLRLEQESFSYKMPHLSPFPILYEDEHLLAINKPAGLLTVPAPESPEHKTVQARMQEWAKKEQDYKPYLLHRLDRDTSGVLLLGKHPRDREALESIFKHPETKKVYTALVKGNPHPPKGTIDLPLQARTQNRKVPAVSHYKIIRRYNDCSLVEVTIETGRKHQIRKHMAMIGHPLVMDKLYGDRRFDQKFRRRTKKKYMELHATRMEFIHPLTQKKVSILSPYKG